MGGPLKHHRIEGMLCPGIVIDIHPFHPTARDPDGTLVSMIDKDDATKDLFYLFDGLGSIDNESDREPRQAVRRPRQVDPERPRDGESVRSNDAQPLWICWRKPDQRNRVSTSWAVWLRRSLARTSHRPLLASARYQCPHASAFGGSRNAASSWVSLSTIEVSGTMATRPSATSSTTISTGRNWRARPP
jgi:hypothetical protein